MQEGENIAGGMSYRTMNGIKTTKIMDYLEGYDDDSSMEILEKNKDYYIASANKTISRLDSRKKKGRTRTTRRKNRTKDLRKDFKSFILARRTERMYYKY